MLDLQCLARLRFGSAGIDTAALTALTSLKLSRCRVSCTSKPAALKGLSALTSLQDLELNLSDLSPNRSGPLALCPAGVLSKLVQLTRLVMRKVEVPAAALRGLCMLSGLLELTLKPPASACALLTRGAVNSIAELQQLTALDLSMVSTPVTNASTPCFSKLTALRSLGLQDSAGLHPEVLAGMSQLVDLDLGDSWVLGGDSAGVAALLNLPAMQRLRKLGLGGSLLELLPADSHTQYSVLTSSWQLSCLSLKGCVLPAEGAWVLVFNRQLPQLRSLDLSAAHTAPLATADLQHIASRCPGLETLCVLSILAGDADLTALQQFPQLTSLSLNNIGDNDAAALASNLTGLRELTLSAPNSLTQGVLHHLADLKQLTQIWVQPNQVPEDEEQSQVDADCDQRMRKAAVRWLFCNKVGELVASCCHSCWVKGCAPPRASAALHHRCSPPHTAVHSLQGLQGSALQVVATQCI